jgi:hypothetical protein
VPAPDRPLEELVQVVRVLAVFERIVVVILRGWRKWVLVSTATLISRKTLTTCVFGGSHRLEPFRD